MAWATRSIKESSDWAAVAAKEAKISQVRAPDSVLLPQETLRAMTAGRNCRSARLLVAST
ncbi:hypothetical protein CKA32_002923 [Geitlerinema sp. FC II]|nr:hypothetical protein CKA32_002896 [Geitlerinema sp. FC II]PPT08875.1 hypothetical protein CKA32_004971 [Geitlerinema sp. FC II]PPT10289.1 hypothetical protein CKA32_002923 [Geitlerinema sp. FC II]